MERIRILFSYWEDMPELNWNKAYLEFLPRVIEKANPLEYYAELMRFISLLKDGHTYVKIPQAIKPPYEVPIGTTFLEGKHVLSELPFNCPIPLFSEIITINNILVGNFLNQYAYPYIWHEKKIAYSDRCYLVTLLVAMVKKK